MVFAALFGAALVPASAFELASATIHQATGTVAAIPLRGAPRPKPIPPIPGLGARLAAARGQVPAAVQAGNFGQGFDGSISHGEARETTVLPSPLPSPAPEARERGSDEAKGNEKAGLKVVDPSIVDKQTSPCADFYQYACGGWFDKNPIPADEASWGRFDELQSRNQDILRTILEEAAAPGGVKTPAQKRLGA